MARRLVSERENVMRFGNEPVRAAIQAVLLENPLRTRTAESTATDSDEIGGKFGDKYEADVNADSVCSLCELILRP